MWSVTWRYQIEQIHSESPNLPCWQAYFRLLKAVDGHAWHVHPAPAWPMPDYYMWWSLLASCRVKRISWENKKSIWQLSATSRALRWPPDQLNPPGSLTEAQKEKKDWLNWKRDAWGPGLFMEKHNVGSWLEFRAPSKISTFSLISWYSHHYHHKTRSD